MGQLNEIVPKWFGINCSLFQLCIVNHAINSASHSGSATPRRATEPNNFGHTISSTISLSKAHLMIKLLIRFCEWSRPGRHTRNDWSFSILPFSQVQMLASPFPNTAWLAGGLVGWLLYLVLVRITRLFAHYKRADAGSASVFFTTGCEIFQIH